MKEYRIDFYSTTNLKSYNLNESMRYQLNILDTLDVFTRKHCENVANLTCRICENLHMKSYFTVYCTMCAYLHDIGKQFIPSSILQKNGPLTDEEYEIMKTHTTIGYKICMNDLNLRKYANGTLYHHESLNGSGYPNGVSSRKIPLEGKIIRVADEFDAIVSKRQYKTHINICDTLKILLEEATPKVNKINLRIVKALIKAVYEDTEYEIVNLESYIKYLHENIERLTQIKFYKNKMDTLKRTSSKEHYKKNIIELLSPGETLDNVLQVLAEYEESYSIRKKELVKLRKELKSIKKMR